MRFKIKRKISLPRFSLRGFLRISTWGISTLIIALLFPGGKSYEFSNLTVGMVSPKEIIAPLDFYVEKSKQELEREREEVWKSIPLIFNHSEEPLQKGLSGIDSLLSEVMTLSKVKATDSVKVSIFREKGFWIPEDAIYHLLYIGGRRTGSRSQLSRIRQASVNLLRGIYEIGVVRDKGELFSEPPSFGIVIQGETERKVSPNDVYDLTEAEENLREKSNEAFPEDDISALVSFEIARGFLAPNFIYDAEDTEQRKLQAVKSVGKYKRFVRKNERIIDSNEVIDQQDIEAIRSLERVKAEHELKGKIWLSYVMFFGRFMVSAFLLSIFVFYLYAFKNSIYSEWSYNLLLMILIIVPLPIASYAAEHISFPEFLIPVALSSILATTLFDAEIGAMLTVTTSLAAGSILGYDFRVTLVSMFCGLVAAFTVRKVRNRYQFYRPIIYLPIAYAATVAAMELLRFTPTSEIFGSLKWGVLNGFLSPVLATGLYPIFESVFNITTDITLLELSDLNHPLLQELAIRAPGTYSHTITVGILAERAAEAIGANPLLARVGAYYHDIGKMTKPEYFIENQVGVKNPHDKLTPRMSSMILASHTKEGIEMAEEHGLPKAIIDFIPQHHGTGLMEYFYNKAIQKGDKSNTSESEFRYSGPKPQIKETAIVMLGDSAEAAVRALPEKTHSRVKGMVKSIIDRKLFDGQLDQCNLTLKDLEKIADTFVPILMGVVHPRIQYPEKERKGERERKAAAEASE